MTTKGIIFSAPMVRALLDGRKTQTRRLAKFVQPDGDGFNIRGNGGGMFGADDDAVRVYGPDYASYAPGDQLYVREAAKLIPDSKPGGYFVPGSPFYGRECFYRADNDYPIWADGPWRPSIHMPRVWSRLWLEVTDVRVQRVQEISEADAIAEGIERPGVGAPFWKCYRPDPAMPVLDPRESFAGLWNSLHTKPGETWEANPWAVAVSFDVAHGNIDRIDHA